MYILLSNDDGYRAEGIRSLSASLADIADIVIVAPERDRSGASNSLTLDDPLRVSKVDEKTYFVDGTPTDCVHLAITGMLDREPDMVISGVNAGPNLGDDVLYSGTVAAAMEGRFLGLPAIAMSMSGEQPEHFPTGCDVARRLVSRLIEEPLPADTILNVNVPDLPIDELRGLKATRLGHRHRAEPVIPAHDPRGRRIYWVGAAGAEQDAGPGTDFHAVANGFVSLTPMQVDLTRRDQLDSLHDWLERSHE